MPLTYVPLNAASFSPREIDNAITRHPLPLVLSTIFQRVDLSTFGQTHSHDMNVNGGSDEDRPGGSGDQRVQCQNM